MKERLDFGALRLPQSLEDRRWIGHRARQDLSRRLVCAVLGKCRTAVGDELVHLKHRDLPPHRPNEKFGNGSTLQIDMTATRAQCPPPGFRCDPFARDVALDPGRASAPSHNGAAMLPRANEAGALLILTNVCRPA